MLKFEFDEEKKKIFLNFWKIKEVSEFAEIATNPDLFFLRLCLLNDVALKQLGQIVAAKVTVKEWDIQEYPPFPIDDTINNGSPHSEPAPPGIEITGEVMEMLDSIHLVTLWQGQAQSSGHIPNKNSDFTLSDYHLTHEFEACFRAFARPLKVEISSGDTEDKSLLLSREEKKTLSHFQEFYGFINNQILLHHPEEVLLSLKSKGYIDFFFLSRNWIPAVTINPSACSSTVDKGKKSSSNTPPPLTNPFPREDLAESLFFLQVLEYQQAGKESLTKYYPTSQEKKDFLENFYFQLSQLPNKLRATYPTLSFPHRVLFLLKHFLPSGYRLLKCLLADGTQGESILESIVPNLGKGMDEKEITYEANRRSFLLNPTGKVYFSQEQVKEAIHTWSLLGLLTKKQGVFYGDRDFLEGVKAISNSSTATPKPSQASNIIIDSDYTLVATKDQIQSEEIYFLYHICNLKISPHLIRGRLNPDKSSLAWYFNFNQKELTSFFKNRCASTWQKSFQEMLDTYFEHTPYFKVGSTIRIVTPSKNFFLTLKYFLEEHNFIPQVTLIEDERCMIFHEPGIFQKVQDTFSESSPPIKFFEDPNS